MKRHRFVPESWSGSCIDTSRAPPAIVAVLAICALALLVRSASGASTIVRTLVYHQITSTAATITHGGSGGQASPILSGDGQRIAYSVPPGGGDPATHIFRINFDGSGQVEVDSYTPLCCTTLLDISTNGGKVVSANAQELRIANGDGSGALPLIALDAGDLSAIAISGDGGKVFFIVARDRCIRDSMPCIPVPRGVWMIDANGSGLQQIVGAAQMEALGIPAPAAFGVSVLSVSADGSQIVFGAFSEPVPNSGGFGQGLFGVDVDGSDLHDYLGRVGFVIHGGVSGDGAKVFYEIATPVQPIHNEIGVLDFGGGSHLLLADERDLCCGTTFFPGSDDRAQLNGDGSRLLLGGGNRAVLVNTDGPGLSQLAIATPGAGALQALLYQTVYRVAMDSSATRFVYLALPSAQPVQLATLELDPGSVGLAPSITDATIEPAVILTPAGPAATVSAQVTAADPLLGVGTTVLVNGVDDPNVFHPVMVDNGTGGDVTAGDGIYTHNGVQTNCCATIAPRTVRVQSGVQRLDGKFHATALEIAPFDVSDMTPGQLNVSIAGSGTGMVSSDPIGIACPGDCAQTFVAGINATVSATASVGSTFAGWLGACTGEAACNVTIGGTKSLTATFAPASLLPLRIDIDGNGQYSALADGLIAIRYLFGFSGSVLISGAIGAGSSRTDPTEIANYLNDVRPILDADGNGNVDALTDGLLIIRYLFGFRGASLIAGAIGLGATRTTAAAIESYLQSILP